MRTRTAPILAAVFVLAGAVYFWCSRRAQEPQGGVERGGEPATKAGADDLHTTPDGVTFAVRFPEKPTWDTVPNLAPPVKGFVWPGDGKRRPHTAWVSVVPPEERERKTDRELALEYGMRAAGISRFGHTEQTPEGVWVGGWHTGRKELSGGYTEFASSGPMRGGGAAKAFVVGDKVYSFRLSGDGIEYDDPELKAFCESFRVDEITKRPAPARAPEDDVRPFARVKKGSIVAFVPPRAAVFVARSVRKELASGKETDVTVIERYHYPSFRSVGTFEPPDFVKLIVPDAARKRLYLVEAPPFVPSPSGFESDVYKHRVVAYDAPEPAAESEKTIPLRPGKVVQFRNRVTSMCVARDGKTLYVLHRRVEPAHPDWIGGKQEIVRIETDGMTVTGTLQLDDGTYQLHLAPDGRALYALAALGRDYRNPVGVPDTMIQEIDPETWKLRRTFTVRGGSGFCAPDGCLYLTTRSHITRVDPNAPNKPAVRMLDREGDDGVVFLAPNGKRLYTAVYDGPVYSADLKELTDFNRWVVAPESANTPGKRFLTSVGARERPPGWNKGDEQSSDGAISSDGKCLLLTSGHAFWLTGAGPLPEVDPASKWKP